MSEPTDINDEALLGRFRDWLRDVRNEADALPVAPDPGPAAEVGLYRLAEEFTALRHEVKLETKGSRGLQEQVDALLPAVRQAIDLLRSVGPKEEQAASAASRPLVEAIADLDEALARGRQEIEKARGRLDLEAAEAAASITADLDSLFRAQPWFRRIGSRSYHDQVRELIQGRATDSRSGRLAVVLEGYGLIQDRLRRSMEAGQVRRIDCVGRPVDPTLMTVVEVVDSPEQPPGFVLGEVRRGYTWRGRVLRYAEVRAVREQAGRTDEVEAIEGSERETD